MADGGSIFSDVFLCGGGARWGEAIKKRQW